MRIERKDFLLSFNSNRRPICRQLRITTDLQNQLKDEVLRQEGNSGNKHHQEHQKNIEE